MALLDEPVFLFGVDSRSVPEWFAGLDGFLQLTFALVTFLIFFYSFGVYRKTQNESSYLFSIGFFLISLSYLIWAVLNFSLVADVEQILCQNACSAGSMVDVVVYAVMILYMFGLLTLTYMTLNINSRATYSLLALLTMTVIAFSIREVFFFFVLTTVFLLFIVAYYARLYVARRNTKVTLTLIVFSLLLLGNFAFVLGVSNGLYYAVGSFLVFVAYIIMLGNLILIVRK